MPVYVDALQVRLKSKRWPFTHSCHMFADTDRELHRMAATLGLLHRWFQTPPARGAGLKPFHHYDLTANKRLEAIAAGAIELETARDTHRHLVRLRYLPEHVSS